MAIDHFKVQAKNYETQHKLLEYIDEAIDENWGTAQINDLALALRYLAGGSQPGAPVLKAK